MRLISAFVAMLAFVLAPAVSAQGAGELIAADPVAETPAGSQAWRIRYWTTSEEGQRIEATGMVVAPREAAPRQPRKVVAWAHGTSGVVQECDLSSKQAFFEVTPALGEMVGAGYVVVAPDYPGLGSAGQHAYLVGRETARSVLDAVRAARSIAGAYAGTDFVVWGESQGGHAALWTAREAKNYAADLNLLGTLAAAPPTDLGKNLSQASDANARAFLTAFVAYSWSKRFDAPLDKLFGPLNRGVANALAQKCISLESNPKLGTLLGILSIRNALSGKDIATIDGWSALIRRNSIRPGDVPGPVYIAQSAEDPLVAPQVTRDFARGLCRRGRSVQYDVLPGGDHPRTAKNSASQSLAWIADRFAGRRAASNCRSI